MKYLLIVLIVMFGSVCFADQYVVEFDKATKKQMSSYTLPDGEVAKVSADRVIVLVTAEEYALLGDGTAWEKNTEDWLKVQKNTDKVDAAIAAASSVKTVEQELAELKAKVAALEAKP